MQKFHKKRTKISLIIAFFYKKIIVRLVENHDMLLNVDKVCKAKKQQQKKTVTFGVELVVLPEKCPLTFKVSSPSHYSLMG